jgi:hypothetical protein
MLRRWIELGPVLALAFASLTGCGDKPRAPALQKESVYQSSEEGFRFQVPDGWTQTAKAVVPAGKHEKERLLVRFNRSTRTNPASLEVTLADLPANTNMQTYLVSDRAGNPGWQINDPSEQLNISGQPATRWQIVPPANQEKFGMIKEIVVFRRGDRYYFFAARFPPEDPKVLAEVRQAVQSVVWKE